MDEEKWEIIDFIYSWYGINIDNDSIEFYYNKSVSGWSWAAVLIVFSENGTYYINDSTDNWEPYQVTESEALEAMLDFETMLKYI